MKFFCEKSGETLKNGNATSSTRDKTLSIKLCCLNLADKPQDFSSPRDTFDFIELLPWLSAVDDIVAFNDAAVSSRDKIGSGLFCSPSCLNSSNSITPWADTCCVAVLSNRRKVDTI